MSVSSEFLSGKAAMKKLLTTKKCRGCFLKDAHLYGVNLGEANLRRATLHEANMEEASLGYFQTPRGARFCNTTMPDGSINNEDC